MVTVKTQTADELMIHILPFALNVLIALSPGQEIQNRSEFAPVKVIFVPDFNRTFSNYCSIDSTRDLQTSAVLSAFFSDHPGALRYATQHATFTGGVTGLEGLSTSQISEMKKLFESVLTSGSLSEEEKKYTQMLVRLMDNEKGPEALFKDSAPTPALDYIVRQSTKHHFLLINEAHYSSQNRAFTTTLLKPLWQKGYRYLALEALAYGDSSLASRRYPTTATGYYLRDPVFGRMVREALAIGYALVPYETRGDVDGTVRDHDQALNICNATLERDTVGKVIVHAGYSHISETGDAHYKPMGSQLREISGQEIFSIDQQTMTEMGDTLKMHPYYRYFINNFQQADPVVFLNAKDEPLVDAINFGGIDVQVYHPVTRYRHGRPDWLMISDAYRFYDLSQDIRDYQGHLLQAVDYEDPSAIPNDQIVINEHNQLLLRPGNIS